MADKLHYAGTGDDGQALYFFHCPGCENAHGFHVPRWEWNGSMDSPTFRPSLVCNRDDPASRCHLWVTDGTIHFLPDCHHELAGQTAIPMPDWDTA